MRVLLTGGAGYIGSHTAVELLEMNAEVFIIDNFSNSDPSVIDRITEISGKQTKFYNCDLTDFQQMRSILTKSRFDAVIHFAGLKSVSDSSLNPLDYYENNVLSTINILKIIEDLNINKFVFSSSATVYGAPKSSQISESEIDFASISTPYGWTKAMCEQIITDQTRKSSGLHSTILRYFNPIGAHASGLIGENPTNPPNNLFPRILNVAADSSLSLPIYGSDYPTTDGTCLRDYIHVVDLAKGHIAALEHSSSGTEIYNLGTGKGLSVLEAINAFELTTGNKVNHHFEMRRSGDQAKVIADVSKIESELAWKTQFTFEDACRDGWKWKQNQTNQ